MEITTKRLGPGLANAQTRGPVTAPIVVESIGRPVAVSGLARLLLRLHTKTALHLVPNEQPRDPVPALEQGPQ